MNGVLLTVNGEVDAVCSVNLVGETVGVLGDIQFVNGNGDFVMEYLFAVHDGIVHGDTGVLLHKYEEICNYYYVGISMNGTRNKIFLKQMYDGFVYNLASNFSVNIEHDTYYQLRIHIINNIHFEISINNALYIIYTEKK